MNHCQDIIVSIVSIAFMYSVFPLFIYSYLNENVGIPWQTIIITVFGSIVLCICYGTMGLIISVVTTAISTGMWVCLGIEKWRLSHPKQWCKCGWKGNLEDCNIDYDCISPDHFCPKCLALIKRGDE
jgi:hypothetical protein